MSEKLVYIVTHGEYSDYTIDGVFSNEEDAKAYASLGGDVETWALDEYAPDAKRIREGWECYFGRINPQTGEITDIGKLDSYQRDGWTKDRAGNLLLHTFARDREHFLKLLVELRQAHLRKKTEVEKDV